MEKTVGILRYPMLSSFIYGISWLKSGTAEQLAYACNTAVFFGNNWN